MFDPQHVLVPVDVGPGADRALVDHLVDAALSIAHRTGARVTFVHAAPPLAAAFAAPDVRNGAAYQALADALARRDAEARRALAGLVERAQASGVPAAARVLDGADSIPELVCRAAVAEAADLLVVTMHGRRGVRRALLGSVAERVAHLSPVPVLLWKS